MDTKELLEILREISLAVAEKIRSDTEDLGTITGEKGAGGDRMKRGDRIAEDELEKIIPRVLSDHGVSAWLAISEEVGFREFGQVDKTDGVFLIIDPIDGSKNMRIPQTRKPFLAFSIAGGFLKDFFEDGTLKSVTAGLIRDIFHEEEYSAIADCGAYMDGTRLSSPPARALSEATMGISLDHRGDELESVLKKGGRNLLQETLCQRRCGSTALDLCRVASGDYDFHVSLTGKAKIHDVAGAKIIVEEVGGEVVLFTGGKRVTEKKWLSELYIRGAPGIKEFCFEIVACGNREIMPNILRVLGK